MKAKDALGRRGEEIACAHLIESGFRVVARNWRCPVGEIDIVAYDGAQLVIVEVKTRSSDAYGHPFEAITTAKLARLNRLGAAWVAAQESGRRLFRIDVVGILCPTSGEPTVEHLRAVV